MARSWTSRRWWRQMLLVAALWFLAAACGGSSADGVQPDGVPDASGVEDAADELAAFDDLAPASVRFRVTIENVTDPEESVELGPGFWLRHRGPDPLFAEGLAERGQGLQSLVEQRDPTRIAKTNERVIRLGTAGVFEATDSGGPVGSGQTMMFELDAFPGESVTFVVPFTDGGDTFIGPGGIGLALFDATRTPISGDVTAVARLWDLGTTSTTPEGQRGVVTPDADADASALVLVTVEPLLG